MRRILAESGFPNRSRTVPERRPVPERSGETQQRRKQTNEQGNRARSQTPFPTKLGNGARCWTSPSSWSSDRTSPMYSRDAAVAAIAAVRERPGAGSAWPAADLPDHGRLTGPQVKERWRAIKHKFTTEAAAAAPVPVHGAGKREFAVAPRFEHARRLSAFNFSRRRLGSVKLLPIRMLHRRSSLAHGVSSRGRRLQCIRPSHARRNALRRNNSCSR